MIDQLVAHNGDKGWKASGYLRGRPSLTRRFDTGTGQDLVEKLGYEIETRARHSVLRSSEGRAQAVAVFLQDTERQGRA